MKKKPVSLIEFLDSYKPEELWPSNLMLDLFTFVPLYDADALVDVIKNDLTEKESDVIFKYYRDGMTYDEIGREYDRTRERIRQIKAKALRKLRGRSRSTKYILYSYEYVNSLQNKIDELVGRVLELEHIVDKVPETVKNNIVKANKTIGMLPDLYVRSYNCLTRYARTNLNQKELYICQLIDMTLEEVMSIRNIGKGSIKNILLSLKNYGGLQLKDCSYDDYIMEEINESRKVL